MAARLRKGSKVKWKWGSGWARGKVLERFTEKVTQTLKGAKVTREATKDEPAFLVEQEDGDRALKSGSELERDN